MRWVLLDVILIEAQRKQMASLPASHKQTILTQWKKKKAALQERLNSISVATAPPTHRTSSHNGPGPESSTAHLCSLAAVRDQRLLFNQPSLRPSMQASFSWPN